ncbi:DUF2637 domain-containing protein [Streptomyces sp. B8F3]|uniref:DUF2637 domain-containing protein n=1 Tax=Streptomyces sp. B8F3 TaxID=3153573 RepID=UPI00325DF603
MATAYRTRGPEPAAAPASGARWWPLLASAAMSTTFAFLAFRLSFRALTDLARAHGVEADAAWMFAVLVDGGAVVGTVGVACARWAGRRTWPYWLTVCAFASLSLTFNIAHSDGSAVGVAIAITPPAAQLVATELLVRLLPEPDGGTAAAAGLHPAAAAAHQAAEQASAAAREVRAAGAEAAAAAEAARTAAEHATAPVTAAGGASWAPAGEVDLAALVAAVEVEAPPTAVDPAGMTPPEPGPLAAMFTAPPLPAADDAHGAAADEPAEVPQGWVAAYRTVERTTGKRPTQNALGAALGLGRTRASEIRAAVEEVLNPPCAVTVP